MSNTRHILAIQPQQANPAQFDLLFENSADWYYYGELSQKINFPTVRLGKNIFPGKPHLHNLFGLQTLDFDCTFSDTFEQISDTRYHDLRSQRQDRPWLILWSGGIDSTVILTSILRNARPQDLSNIVVACSASSMIENPRFYTDHILPNFPILNSVQLEYNRNLFENYHVITGHPADALYCQYDSVLLQANLRNPGVADLSFRTNLDQLLDVMQNHIGCTKNLSAWWYEKTLENIESQSIPVETIQDFFWYNSFNFGWSGTLLREIKLLRNRHWPDLTAFQKSYVPWYNTKQYQSWSINNNQRGFKYGVTMGQCKVPSKKYIHSFDKNDYYLQFKTKIVSDAIYDQSLNFFCLLDDFSELHLPQDFDKIQSLMPDFVQSKGQANK